MLLLEHIRRNRCFPIHHTIPFTFQRTKTRDTGCCYYQTAPKLPSVK